MTSMIMSRKRKRVELPPFRWKKGPIIGKGGSAVVRLGFIDIDGDDDYDDDILPSVVAIKSSRSSNSSSLIREKHVIQDLADCPHIIRCFGGDGHVDDESYHIFLELAPRGTLFDAIRTHGQLDEMVVRRYTKSILLGLSHVHRGGYVHCDVKPHNILVFSDKDVKIADFGLAKLSGAKISKRSSSMTSVHGTPLYVAPESVRRNEYEAPVDVWALGCTVVEMATGKPAWRFPAGVEAVAVYVLFRIWRCDPLPEVPEELSEMGKDFVSKCLVKDPKQRWTVEELLQHRFVLDC